jgi:N-acetylglutamate synthase-like GNAT family acetyltransferase
MPALTIRPATVADQPIIRRMISQANLNRMSLSWQHFLLAEEDGRTVGVGQVKRHWDGSRELASIAVVPARQGQGIGSAVVRELIAIHGHELLHLTCRRETQGFYERFGFSPVPRPEYPPYFARLLPAINAIVRLFGERIVLMRRNPPSQDALEPS